MNPMGSSRAHGDAHQNWRKSLRNAAINYRNGWFFVTCQVAHNNSIFGAIVGERCELNDLGRLVEKYWRAMPSKYPELELDEFVLMPNHFHAIVRVHYRPTNKEQHLGFLMGRFKGGTGFIYGKLRRSGEVEDIGEHLWQQDYWDKIVTNESQLAAYRKYIRENPSNWTRDRFGAVTQYAYGNIGVFNGQDQRAERYIQANAGRRDGVAISECGASAPPPLVSTFTSAQEREALRRAIANGRPVIQVIPQGIPPESELPCDLLAACRAGRALLLSPQPAGSRLNKKVATWCNEYVLRHADEIWVGDVSPNGMLAAMLKALGRSG